MDTFLTPDLMPVLSRGKHRSPRRGACFMELASYLAGERWSDHPACTHPLLAALARDVNDHLSDAARPRIASLIPEVIGLDRRDPVVDVWFTREVALAALPVASAARQGVIALGLLRCEQVLAELQGHPEDHLTPRVAAALAQVPQAHRWAREFSQIGGGRPDRFTRHGAPAIIHCAVTGIAQAVVEDPEQLLVDLLHRMVGRCQAWMPHEPVAAPEEWWREVSALTAR